MARLRRVRRPDDSNGMTEEELLDLASNIEPSYYRPLGYELGFLDARLETIRLRRHADYRDSMQDIFMEWKTRQEPGTDLRAELIRHLQAVGLDSNGNRLPFAPGRHSGRLCILLVLAVVVSILGVLGMYLHKGTLFHETEYVIGKLTLEQLRGRLVDEYENRRYFKIYIKPWDKYDSVDLKNYYTAVSLYKKDNDNIPDAPAQKITLNGSVNDVFQTKVGETLPKRILLVGEAGRGKTTAVAKMAYDWAYKVDGSPLRNIPLLFVFKMRHMNKTTNFTEGIVRLLGKKYTKYQAQLKEYIDSHKNDIVLLFDGYDEYRGSIIGDPVSDVIDILRYDSCKECRVLVTTRPYREWEFSFRDPDFGYSKMELEGYPHEHAIMFIDSFFKTNQTKAIKLKQYLEHEPVMTEMITTPLFCTMVCYMWNKDHLHGSYTRTAFFKNIIDFLWKHAKYRKDINVMPIMEQRVNLDDLIMHVGRVAFMRFLNVMQEQRLLYSNSDLIVNNVTFLIDRYIDLSDNPSSLLFIDKDFMNNLTYLELSLKIGLLTANTTFDDDMVVFIEFFHKLAQEYSAGKYFSNRLNENMAILSNVRDAVFVVPHFSEVLRFASGMSDRACEKILNEFIHGRLETALFSHYMPRYEFVLDVISEADKCAANVESNLTSFFRKGLVGLHLKNPSVSMAVGFEKLPAETKNQITRIYVNYLSTPVFRRLWKNLHSCTRLSELIIDQPILPKISKDMRPLPTVRSFFTNFHPPADIDVGIISLLPNLQEFKDMSRNGITPNRFTTVWNTLSTSTNLTRLDLYISPTTVSQLNPITSVRVFETRIGLSPDDFIRVLGKLPNVTELIISPDTVETMTEFVLTPDGFSELWNNLSILPHLHRLSLYMPPIMPSELKPLTTVKVFETSFPTKTPSADMADDVVNVFTNLPKIQEMIFQNSKFFERMDKAESTRVFMKLWNTFSSYENLTILKFSVPSNMPRGLEPLTKVKTFQTTVGDIMDPLSIGEILDLLPAVQEITLVSGNLSISKINIEFHDIFISAFIDKVVRNNLSLKVINITFHVHTYQKTIMHDTVKKFIGLLETSPEVQYVDLQSSYKYVFEETDLVDIVKAVRSISSMVHFGIPCDIDTHGELYRYVSQNSKPEQVVSSMELSEQRKSFIKLIVHKKYHPFSLERSPDQTLFLSRLRE